MTFNLVTVTTLEHIAKGLELYAQLCPSGQDQRILCARDCIRRAAAFIPADSESERAYQAELAKEFADTDRGDYSDELKALGVPEDA
jgi:hypothetical protein